MKFIIVLFFLTSCIFQSFERENTIQDVKVVMQKQDEVLFIIKKDLEERFNLKNQTDSMYKMIISKTQTISGVGLKSDANVSSFEISITVNFTLIDNKTNKTILQNSATAKTNLLSSQNNLIAEYSNEKFATQVLAKILSDKIYETVQNNFAFKKFSYTKPNIS